MIYTTEHSFVANIFRYPNEVDNVLDIVQPEDLVDKNLGGIYGAIIKLTKAKKPVTTTLVYEESKCDANVLSGLMDEVPSKDSIPHYAKLISDKNVSNVSNVSNVPHSIQNVSKTSARMQETSASVFDTAEVRDWIVDNPGIFTTVELDREFNIISRKDKNKRSALLKRMQKQGLINHYGTGKGRYKTVNQELIKMDFNTEAPKAVELPLPLGVDGLCKVYPGSIIIVAGSPNAGKSAYVITLIKNIYNNYYNKETTFSEKIASVISPDLKDCRTIYLNSEASNEEVKDRLSNFSGGISQFSKAEFFERSGDYADVVDPNGVNIIDFMEIYENFWEIGAWINDVHRKLEKGVAIICVQKKKGADMGRGGEMGLEKPRLYITLENNMPHGAICKIQKAKILKDFKNNPNGKEIDFTVYNGAEINPISDWRYVADEKERVKINKGYDVDKIERMDAKDYVMEFETVEGHTVKLNQRDFNKWSASAPHGTNVYDKLLKVQAQRPWLKKKSWFYQLGGYIAK